MSAISVRDLEAGRLGIKAVHGIGLDAHPGQVHLLLGPNGAGKTTTLLTIAGLLPALGGTIEVLGKPVKGGNPRRQIARGLAYVPENRGLFHQLTARENLRLRSRGHRAAESSALDPFPSLTRILDRRVGLLSGGEQQMLAVACALALKPKALMIDELTLGLAPCVVGEILPVVQQIARTGVAVLLVEQHVHAALTVADHATILQHGRVVRSGPASALRGDTAAVAAGYFGSDPTGHGTPEVSA